MKNLCMWVFIIRPKYDIVCCMKVAAVKILGLKGLPSFQLGTGCWPQESAPGAYMFCAEFGSRALTSARFSLVFNWKFCHFRKASSAKMSIIPWNISVYQLAELHQNASRMVWVILCTDRHVDKYHLQQSYLKLLDWDSPTQKHYL